VPRAGGKYNKYELSVTVNAINEAFQTDDGVQAESEMMR
jgi:hypothetical protein